MPKLGHTLVRLEEVGSTNSWVLENESYLDQHGLVVMARRQSAGRGRMGRTWVDLPGNQLFASTVIHPRTAAADIPVISLIAGLAVASAIADMLALDARLKWPNDVLIHGKKVAGILVESKPGAQGAQRLVVGTGVNCQGSTQAAPPELQASITTLSQEAGRLVDPETVLHAILERLDGLLERLAQGRKAELLVEWARRARVVGRWVDWQAPQGQGTGIVQGISPDGYLVVEDAAGVRHLIVSGQVYWRD